MEQGVMSAPNESSSDLLHSDSEETPLSSRRSADDLVVSQTSDLPRHELPNGRAAQSDSEDTQVNQYNFTRENKIAVMEDTVSILLTEDTMRLMANTIVENKTYQNYEAEYENMKRGAAAGEAFIELQQMERELSVRKSQLEYKRGQLDDIMEQIMADVGVYERPAPEHQVEERPSTYDNDRLSAGYSHPEKASESNSTRDTIHEARTYEFTNSSAWKARVRLESAVDRAILAQDRFDRRREGYYDDVSDYGHDHTRTEIDHEYFRKGAELTRQLIDAEEEYHLARAEAMALDLLANTTNQEFDFANEEDDGYRESEDPICDIHQVDRAFIEVSKFRSFPFPFPCFLSCISRLSS